MEPSENPYAASSNPEPFGPAALARNSGLISHVQVVGILQIVLGALELLIGGMYALGGSFFAFSSQLETPNGPAAGGLSMYVMMGGMLMLGAGVMLFAAMRIFSGIAAFSFRGRGWMIASLIGGMLSALTCYCALFSIGLAIYGLIVMFDAQVIAAYRLGSQGISAAEIRHQHGI